MLSGERVGALVRNAPSTTSSHIAHWVLTIVMDSEPLGLPVTLSTATPSGITTCRPRFNHEINPPDIFPNLETVLPVSCYFMPRCDFAKC